MTNTPSDPPIDPAHAPAPESEHAWIHDHLATYLADGLDAAERQCFDAHINACSDCFDAFIEARDADRLLQRTLGTLAPPSTAQDSFEDRLVTHFRGKTMTRARYYLVRRSAYATAAALALAATGVFANYAIHQNGRFNNALSRELVARADTEQPTLTAPMDRLASLLANSINRNRNASIPSPSESPATRPMDRKQAMAVYSDATHHSDAALEANPPQFAQAIVDAQKAMDAIDQNKGAFSAIEADALRDAASRQLLNATSRQNAFNREQANRNALASSNGDGTRAISLSTQRQLKVGQLTADAQRLVDAGNFQAAADLLRQVTVIDPQDEDAKLKFRLVDLKNHDRDYENLIHRMGAETMRQNVDGTEHLVPYKDLTVANANTEAYSAGAGISTSSGTVNAKDNIAKLDISKSAIVQTGTGTLTLQNNTFSNYSGGTSVANGVLEFNALSAGGHIGPAGGGTVTLGSLNSFGFDQAIPQQSGVSTNGNSAIVKGMINDGEVAGRSEEDQKNLKLAPNAIQPGQLEDQQMGMRAGSTLGSDANAQKSSELMARKLNEQVASNDSRESYAFDLPAIKNSIESPTTPIVAATQPSAASAPTPQAAAAASAPKVIYNGTVEYEVRSFDDTYATVSQIAGQEGGFVSAASSDKLANGKVRGSIVVRIPPEHLQRFLLEIRALGDVKSSQIGSTNISKEYTDTESELRGLRTMETRLLDLIKTGKGEVKDLIEAETKLGDVRIRLEKLEGELQYYDNLVGMATLTITAYEKDIQSPTAASEQESVNLSLETEEVEAKYQAARKILDDAKARIVESQLKNTDADHIAATITADVPPEQADFVAAQLKQLGKVSGFSRDRRQTTAGGTGTPAPHVQVEKKDTRFGISMYNLANLAPRETTVLTIAVRDVEGTYKKILALVRQDAAPSPAAGPAEGNATTIPAMAHASGRIVSSNLNGQLPEQMSADVRAELRTDGAGSGGIGGSGGADAIVQAIRDSGEVLTSALAENPDNAGSTSAKRGIQLRLVNIAAVPPKETVTINVAVRDVESSYRKIIALIQKPIAQPARASSADATGRLLANSVNGQVAEQMTADIWAEIRADQAEAVLQAMRDAGEVISSSTAQTTDNNGNITQSKEGVRLRFINVASVAARETQNLRVVAMDVSASYNKLLASLQAIADAGNGGARVISSHLNESDPRTINASLQFEARRDALPAVDKAFADAGIDFLSRTINRATNTAGTLDSKIYFQIDELKSAEALDPRRTFTLGVEVDDVERALETLRSSVSGTPVKEMDFSTTKEASGRVTGHIVLDAPTANTIALLARIRDLGGIERDNQVSQNAQVPDTRFSKDRIDLTLTSRSAIVQADQGLWPTVRAALSSASGALIYSLYLVLTGLLFILPFALIIWPFWRIARRRKVSV